MIIKGDSYSDQRGTLRFVNDFHFKGIKRFYTITHPDTTTLRAWQGHKIETKYFFVTKGRFLVGWVTIDQWDHPSHELPVNKQELSAEMPQILTISPGNANGFKALEPDSTMVIFSDLSIEESSKDMYRFETNYWILD